jgi:hypothetical protein
VCESGGSQDADSGRIGSNQSIGLFLVMNLMQKRFLMQKMHDKIVKSTIAIIGRLRTAFVNEPREKAKR